MTTTCCRHRLLNCSATMRTDTSFELPGAESEIRLTGRFGKLLCADTAVAAANVSPIAAASETPRYLKSTLNIFPPVHSNASVIATVTPHTRSNYCRIGQTRTPKASHNLRRLAVGDSIRRSSLKQAPANFHIRG